MLLPSECESYDAYLKNLEKEIAIRCGKSEYEARTWRAIFRTHFDDDEIEKLFNEYKAKYAAWSARDDIKAEFKVNIILKLADYHYPPVTVDEVYKEVLAQAINFRKFAE